VLTGSKENLKMFVAVVSVERYLVQMMGISKSALIAVAVLGLKVWGQ